MKQLTSVCASPEDAATPSASKESTEDATVTAEAELKMQVPGPDGQACWKVATFALYSNGVLKWKSSEPWPWDAGAIDIRKALGVWLLGPPGVERSVTSQSK